MFTAHPPTMNYQPRASSLPLPYLHLNFEHSNSNPLAPAAAGGAPAATGGGAPSNFAFGMNVPTRNSGASASNFSGGASAAWGNLNSSATAVPPPQPTLAQSIAQLSHLFGGAAPPANAAVTSSASTSSVMPALMWSGGLHTAGAGGGGGGSVPRSSSTLNYPYSSSAALGGHSRSGSVTSVGGGGNAAAGGGAAHRPAASIHNHLGPLSNPTLDTLRAQSMHQAAATNMLDSDEAAMEQEEQDLREKLGLILAANREVDQSMLAMQVEWRAVHDRAMQFATEPVPDITANIEEQEGRVAMAQAKFQAASERLASLEAQLPLAEQVEQRKSVLQTELDELCASSQQIEARRQRAIAVVERHVDNESQRHRELSRALSIFDYQENLSKQQRHRSNHGSVNTASLANRGKSVSFAHGGVSSVARVNLASTARPVGASAAPTTSRPASLQAAAGINSRAGSPDDDMLAAIVASRAQQQQPTFTTNLADMLVEPTLDVTGSGACSIVLDHQRLGAAPNVITSVSTNVFDSKRRRTESAAASHKSMSVGRSLPAYPSLATTEAFAALQAAAGNFSSYDQPSVALDLF